MSLAFGAHVSVAGGVDKAFARAEDFDMEAIQIFSKNERQWHAKPLAEDVVERWYAERERSGIDKVVVHASYLINIATQKYDLLLNSNHGLQKETQRFAKRG